MRKISVTIIILSVSILLMILSIKVFVEHPVIGVVLFVLSMLGSTIDYVPEIKDEVLEMVSGKSKAGGEENGVR